MLQTTTFRDGGALGDQPVDPAFLRAIVALVSGTTQDYLEALRRGSPTCAPDAFRAGDCHVSPDDDWSQHQSSSSRWWSTLDDAWGLVTQQIGRDDLRPRFFYAGTMRWNADYVMKLVGDLTWKQDPQGLVATKVTVTPSIVGAWLGRWNWSLGPRHFSTAQLADLVALIQTAHRAVDEARGLDSSASSVLRDLPASIWRDPAFQDFIQGAFNRMYALLVGGGAPVTVQRLFDLPAAGVLVLVRSLVGVLDTNGKVIGASAGVEPVLLRWAAGAPTPGTAPSGSPRHPWIALVTVAALSVGGVAVYRRYHRGAR